MLPLSKHCAVKLRCRRPVLPPLRYSTMLQLTTPLLPLLCCSALRCRHCAAATALPLRCHCQRPALPSCMATALRRQGSDLPLRCSCHAAAANALRCRAPPLRCSCHAAAANALRCLRRHHCAPPLCCSRIALPSCAAAALRGHHCAPPLRCSCQRLALPPLRCSALHCRRCAARRQQINNNNKDNHHLRSQPTQMLRPPPPLSRAI